VLPDSLNGVPSYRFVSRDARDPVNRRLANEHSIERVSMNRRQVTQQLAVGESHESLIEAGLGDDILQIFGCVELSLSALERHLPGRHDTHEYFVGVVPNDFSG